MNKKLIVGIAATAVVGLGGFVALPYTTGSQAEAHFDAAIGRVKSPYMEWHKISYERGFYSARATSEIVVRTDKETFTIPLQHTIMHAPLAGVGAASVKTEVQLPEPARTEMAKMFGDASPLVFDTVFGFGGNSSSDYSSPAFTFEEEGTKIVSQGLSGTIETKGTQVIMNGTFPALEGTTPGETFAINDVSFGIDMTQAADEQWLGTANFSLGQFNVQEKDGTKVQIEAVRVDERIVEQSVDLLGAVVGVSAKRMSFGDRSITDAAYDAEMKNLDRAALQTYSKDVSEIGPDTDPEAAGMAVMGSMMRNGPLLLKRSPQFNQRVRFTTTEGTFNGKVDVGFDGEGEFQLALQDLLMRTRVDANFDAAKALVEVFVGYTMRDTVQAVAAQSGEAVTEEQIAASVKKMSSARLDALIGEGMLVEKGENYTSAALFEKGQFSVNGKDMGNPLAMFAN